MKHTILRTSADLQWLSEVHGVDTSGAALVLVHGNEDAPSRVEVYAVDDYRATPVEWVADATGTLRRVEHV